MNIDYYSPTNFNNVFDEIYSRLIKDKVPATKPTAYLLGGQSGSGKSVLYRYIDKINDEELIGIDGDSFRRYHPNSAKLKENYGKDDVNYTAKFSGKMVEKLISKLSDSKYNLIIEGTLRTTETPIKTAKELIEKGYEVNLMVMAVKPELSYLSTLMRYEATYANSPEQARATLKKHHDLIIKNLPNNLDKIKDSNLFSQIELIDRNEKAIYNSHEDKINPSEVINDFWSHKWTEDEFEMFEQSFKLTCSLRMKRNHFENSDLTKLIKSVNPKLLRKIDFDN